MSKLYKADQQVLAGYVNRIENTYMPKLLQSTQDLVGYFVGLGDDLLTAQGKVQQLSASVGVESWLYSLGNTQPLKDAINASGLVFMDAPAKAQAVSGL